MAQSISQEAIGATGLPGATAASRHAGATTSGAPTTGTFAVGDYVVDQTGAMYICTVAGTPGTWQLSGVSVNENIAGKNVLINGGMDIWQRGTSFSITAGNATYTADRWQALPLGANTITCSQVTANVKTTSTSSVAIGTGSLSFTISTGLVIAAGQGFEAYYTSGPLNAVYGTVASYNSSTGVLVANITNTIGSGTYAAWTVTVATLPQFNYALRTQRNSGNTSTGSIYQTQTVETLNSIPLAGKTITFSLWARAGANFSASGINAGINAGFGNDGNVLAGMNGSVPVFSSSFAPTTSWQLFTFIGTVPSGASQIGLNLYYNPTGTAGANDYFDITGLQIEIAPQATPFSRAGGSIGGELALCQRYYLQVISDANNAGATLSPLGAANTTSSFYVPFLLPVTMRTVPSGTVAFANLQAVDGANSFTITAVGLAGSSNTTQVIILNISVSGTLTQFRPYWIRSAISGGYLGFTAEL